MVPIKEAALVDLPQLLAIITGCETTHAENRDQLKATIKHVEDVLPLAVAVP